ncbi:hypothetical protein KSP9073_03466 [Kushneria phyllosphaerae]|uniref:Uncharacterized protein n=1 Tax=Kushneria phyllosphaerae TaxID=2100822 RepID=A0A2R8CRI1_9GAMM|nr:hypothetical protein KSP9073_03466 [Kushneria phyllosphaerae]
MTDDSDDSAILRVRQLTAGYGNAKAEVVSHCCGVLHLANQKRDLIANGGISPRNTGEYDRLAGFGSADAVVIGDRIELNRW